MNKGLKIGLGVFAAVALIVGDNSFFTVHQAAQALVLTQPALSARIQALEREMGTQLFHRMGRGVRPTDAGQSFLPFAERALDAVNQGREALSATQPVDSGPLPVATARARGCLDMLPTSSEVPTMIPAWGPPKSLSPEKNPTLTPSETLVWGIGSCSKPN